MDRIDALRKYQFDYDAIKHQIGNFDLLLYRDMDPISRVIRAAESLTKGCGMFSHAGLAVRGDLLIQRYPHVDPDEIYVFESTLSGYWNDNVLNIAGETYFGAQLRPLREQLASPTRTIAWCPLTPQLHSLIVAAPTKVLDTIQRYNGIGYNYHVLDLLTAAFPLTCCEALRDAYGHADNDLMFCSELAAKCLSHIGVLDAHIKANTVLPVDFLGPSIDIPCVVSAIVYLDPATSDP